MFDAKSFRQTIIDRKEADLREQIKDSEVYLYDGDMTLRGEVYGHLHEEFEFIERDTGTAMIRLLPDHYLAQWITDHLGRAKRNVHVRFQKGGVRWTGFMDNYRLVRDNQGRIVLEVQFKHDYEHLKHILVWANPFTPDVVQFPKVWMIFGRTRWIAAITLWVNLFRLESSIWSLPSDPFDEDEWFNFDQRNWDIVVVPVNYFTDSTNLGFIFSRFKTFHDAVVKLLEDAQVSIECQRYYDGDPEPEGLGFTPKHGALVVRFVDNSEWTSGTSFFGNILTGLERAYVNIASDGFTEGINTVQGDPTFPEQYYIPGWRGTRPEAPHVVLTDDWESGVETSEFVYYEATDVQAVTGGQSAPGVNEAIKVGVLALGSFISSMVETATQVSIGDIGGIMDAIAEPIYRDSLMAFQHQDFFSRAQALGEFHLKEGWADPGGQAWTLGAFAALRTKMFSSKEHVSHDVKLAEIFPYKVGPNGVGDFWIGTRVATGVATAALKNRLFVDQVQKLKWTRSSDGKRGWDATIGWREPQDPYLHALATIQEFAQGIQQTGL